jgi:hypothetical protein
MRESFDVYITQVLPLPLPVVLSKRNRRIRGSTSRVIVLLLTARRLGSRSRSVSAVLEAARFIGQLVMYYGIEKVACTVQYKEISALLVNIQGPASTAHRPPPLTCPPHVPISAVSEGFPLLQEPRCSLPAPRIPRNSTTPSVH